MLGKGAMMAGPSTVYKDTNVLGKGRGGGERDGKEGTPGQDIGESAGFDWDYLLFRRLCLSPL